MHRVSFVGPAWSAGPDGPSAEAAAGRPTDCPLRVSRNFSAGPVSGEGLLASAAQSFPLPFPRSRVPVTDLSSPAQPRRAVLRRPEAVAVAVTVLALPFAALLMITAGRSVPSWFVVLLLAAFVAVESLSLVVEVRSHSFSFALTEVVLVIGLVQLGGLWTSLASAAAAPAVTAPHRVALPKVMGDLGVDPAGGGGPVGL